MCGVLSMCLCVCVSVVFVSVCVCVDLSVRACVHVWDVCVRTSVSTCGNGRTYFKSEGEDE